MAGIVTQTTALATIPSAIPIAADNVGTANAPVAGDRIQYVKLDLGIAGSSSPVTPANPLSAAVTDGTTIAKVDTVSFALKTHEVGGRSIVGSYSCGTGQVAGAASLQNVLSIENPVGSGKTVFIKRIEVQAGLYTASTTLKWLYLAGRTTGVPTAGTTLTSQKHATADATAVAIVRQAGTATAAAGSAWNGAPGAAMTLVGSQAPVQLFLSSSGRDSSDILLAAGEGFMVQAQTNNTGVMHSIDVYWDEGSGT